MKKILFGFICFLCMMTFAWAKNYTIKEIPEMSKYNPDWLWEPENGKMTFYGQDYECALDIDCNMYSYDFNGNVTKLNNWGGFGSVSGETDELSIKEKVGEEYLVQTCHYDASGKKDNCNTLENLKVTKLIKTNLGLSVLEIYDADSKMIKYAIYDGKGKEISKLSSNLELIVPYEIDNSVESKGEYKISDNSYLGDDNIIIFKNVNTNNYHVVGINGKEEIITLDILKKYGLDSNNVLKLQISLSDNKNIYHVDRKIFGDSKGVFSSKKYENAYAAKFGEDYVIIDDVKNDKANYDDSYYNDWYLLTNVYSIDGNPLVTENEYVFVNEDILSDGLIVMYNKAGKVIVRDINSVLLEKTLNIKETLDSRSSVIHNGNVYFVIETPDEYGNRDKGYAFVLEIKDEVKPEDSTTKNEIEKEYSYEFIKGVKVTFKIDSKNHVSFTIDGDFKLFKEVYIDGKLLDSKNYSVKEGSTIINLNNDYARKLADGKEHTIKVIYNNGKEVSTTFMVEENLENPHTGQAISILFLTGLIGLAIVVKNKRKNNVLNKI